MTKPYIFVASPNVFLRIILGYEFAFFLHENEKMLSSCDLAWVLKVIRHDCSIDSKRIILNA